eukprot:scaffold926_cov248-Pinguiococcus_pyrenoidosus.AAC.24
MGVTRGTGTAAKAFFTVPGVALATARRLGTGVLGTPSMWHVDWGKVAQLTTGDALHKGADRLKRKGREKSRSSEFFKRFGIGKVSENYVLFDDY